MCDLGELSAEETFCLRRAWPCATAYRKPQDFCTINTIFAGSQMIHSSSLAIYTMNDKIQYSLAKKKENAANVQKYVPNPQAIKTILLKSSAPDRKIFYWMLGYVVFLLRLLWEHVSRGISKLSHEQNHVNNKHVSFFNICWRETASHIALTVQTVLWDMREKKDFVASPGLGLGVVSAVPVALQMTVVRLQKVFFMPQSSSVFVRRLCICSGLC